MEKITYYNYLNDKVKVYNINLYKIINPQSFYELKEFNYDNNYHIWSSYDYFINMAIKNNKIESNILDSINKLKKGKTRFSDINLINMINAKYDEIIKIIENKTGLVYGLDYILN